MVRDALLASRPFAISSDNGSSRDSLCLLLISRKLDATARVITRAASLHAGHVALPRGKALATTNARHIATEREAPFLMQR